MMYKPCNVCNLRVPLPENTICAVCSAKRKQLVLYVVELRVIIEGHEDCMIVHLSTDVPLAVQWIKKHGLDWQKEPYWFAVMSVVLDNDAEMEAFNTVLLYDIYGNSVESPPTS
jgi:hypothetical protein